MYGWAYKVTWIATRATPEALADVLGLEQRTPTSWAAGLESAYRQPGHVFVTPAVDGWAFAVGRGVDVGVPDVEGLAAALGDEVQVFGSHRVVSYVMWMRAMPGVGARRFSYVGEQGELEVDGVPTDIEFELDIDTFTELHEADDWDAIDEWPDETTVLEIAADWSIDPRTFEEMDLADAVGTIGIRPEHR